MINFDYNSFATATRTAPSKSDDYRARAAHCANEAQEATSETMKHVGEDMARAWLRLAEEAEKYDPK